MNIRQAILIIILSMILILGFLFLHQFSGTVQAQSNNFSGLITTLNERIKQESGFTFQIVLSNYANPQGQVISLGNGEYGISELGSDYVCVNRQAGAALTTSCIPFTNIEATLKRQQK